MTDWRKVFELENGRPTGRWQWSLEAPEGEYRYPGAWVSPESIMPPPSIPASGGAELPAGGGL